MSEAGVTAGPYQYIEATGVIVTDTSEILSEIEGEYTSAISADLNTAASTPQGVLINAEALVRAEVVANNAAVANQINPNIAGGIFLESICAITGVDPPAATNTIVPGVSVTGVPRTSIPAGAQAKTATGDIFQMTETVVLDATGNGTVDFEATETGPVPCAVGALSVAGGGSIVSGVLGWETVNNTVAGTLGLEPPTDAQLRALRNQALALQGSSLAEAITSALAVVPGFRSKSFRENIEWFDQTIDGIFLKKNSIWACVDGGADTDIATALLAAKSGGCNWNGSTAVGVIDPYSGQTFNVLFDRPTSIGVRVKATVRLPSSAVTSEDVTAAILAYAAGQISGQDGFVTGGAASPFEIAGAIMASIPNIFVPKVEIGLAPAGALQTTEIEMALNQKAAIAASDIQIVVVN